MGDFLDILMEGADWVWRWTWTQLVRLAEWFVHWLLGNQAVRDAVTREIEQAAKDHLRIWVDQTLELVKNDQRVQICLVALAVLALVTRISQRSTPKSR